MSLDVLEIGVIAVMGVAIFVWGPEKVPEIAKSIASARKQLNGYTKQLQGITKELESSMSSGNFDNLGNVLMGEDAPISSNPNREEIFAATKGTAGSPAAYPDSAVVQAPSPSTPPPAKSGDLLLLEMAKQLRISTQGKTKDEIQNEIIARASSSVEVQATEAPAAAPSEPAPAQPPATGKDQPPA